MAMRVFVVIVMRVLGAMIVFMRPGVWVRVARLAVTMQVTLDEFVGSGGHCPSG